MTLSWLPALTNLPAGGRTALLKGVHMGAEYGNEFLSYNVVMGQSQGLSSFLVLKGKAWWEMPSPKALSCPSSSLPGPLPQNEVPEQPWPEVNESNTILIVRCLFILDDSNKGKMLQYFNGRISHWWLTSTLLCFEISFLCLQRIGCLRSLHLCSLA